MMNQTEAATTDVAVNEPNPRRAWGLDEEHNWTSQAKGLVGGTGALAALMVLGLFGYVFSKENAAPAVASTTPAAPSIQTPSPNPTGNGSGQASAVSNPSSPVEVVPPALAVPTLLGHELADQTVVVMDASAASAEWFDEARTSLSEALAVPSDRNIGVVYIHADEMKMLPGGMGPTGEEMAERFGVWQAELEPAGEGDEASATQAILAASNLGAAQLLVVSSREDWDAVSQTLATLERQDVPITLVQVGEAEASESAQALAGNTGGEVTAPVEPEPVFVGPTPIGVLATYEFTDRSLNATDVMPDDGVDFGQVDVSAYGAEIFNNNAGDRGYVRLPTRLLPGTTGSAVGDNLAMTFQVTNNSRRPLQLTSVDLDCQFMHVQYYSMSRLFSSAQGADSARNDSIGDFARRRSGSDDRFIRYSVDLTDASDSHGSNVRVDDFTLAPGESITFILPWIDDATHAQAEIRVDNISVQGRMLGTVSQPEQPQNTPAPTSLQVLGLPITRDTVFLIDASEISAGWIAEFQRHFAEAMAQPSDHRVDVVYIYNEQHHTLPGAPAQTGPAMSQRISNWQGRFGARGRPTAMGGALLAALNTELDQIVIITSRRTGSGSNNFEWDYTWRQLERRYPNVTEQTPRVSMIHIAASDDLAERITQRMRGVYIQFTMADFRRRMQQ